MTPTIRKTLLSLLTAAVAAYAVVHLSGPTGVAALFEKRAEIKAIQDENRLLEERVAGKAQYVEDIKAKKPEVIIPLIRNKTNWVREGEKDFRFENNRPLRRHRDSKTQRASAAATFAYNSSQIS